VAHPSPVDPFLRALVEHWADVVDAADDDQRQRLTEILDRAAGGADPLDVKNDLEDLVFEMLPPRHPVVEIMRETTLATTTREAPEAAAELDTSVARLVALVGPLSVAWPGGPADRHAGEPAEPSGGDQPIGRPGADLQVEPWRDDRPDDDQPDDDWADDELPAWEGAGPADDELDAEVRDRLLDLPRLNAQQVRANDADPARPELIRLTDADGDEWFPRFQFDDRGTPWSLILELNALLGAHDDPWGVTCWWVDPHARLAVAPADLLGRDDDLLRRAARAVTED
jgi:hypothetical protein